MISARRQSETVGPPARPGSTSVVRETLATAARSRAAVVAASCDAALWSDAARVSAAGVGGAMRSF